MDVEQSIKKQASNQLLPPEVYWKVFQMDAEGLKIFEELCSLFYDIKSFDPENPHMTSYREGQRSVMQLIIAKLSLSQQPESEE